MKPTFRSPVIKFVLPAILHSQYAKFVLILLLAGLQIYHLKAQAPQSFPYQAVARNASGNLLSSQTISLQISILNGSNLGPVVFQERHLATTNSLGLFSINIGQGTVVSGTFSSINWASGSKFIKVELDPAGGLAFTNMGTSQLLSVPYALHANVPGVPGPTGPTGPAGPGGQTVLNGNVAPSNSIGTNGDFYLNTATSQLYGPKAAGVWPAPVSLIGATGATGPAGSANINGTTNNLIKFTGTTTGGNSLLFDNGSSVAMGTTSPSASALLQLNSSSKGVLFPQVSIDSLKDVTSIASPANGLIVYNTTQPGALNDLARGYYYYSTSALSWIRLADNLNDTKWQDGGTLGIQLRDKTDGVEMMDNYLGTSVNNSPKVRILKMLDSASINSKNNINALVLSGVERKANPGWRIRQKTSIIFENSYQTTAGIPLSGTNSVAISSYTENSGTTTSNATNGLAFYTFATPQNTSVSDTPSMSLFRHNIGIGAYATDINNVTEGRLQITGFSNGDLLSLRHPSNSVLKWGLYVSSIDSSLNFYSNGSLRANIDRVTGVYTALSDRRMKKDIVELQPVLSKLRNLKAYNYHYLDSKESDRKVNGFMAQDLLEVFPELVYQRYDRTIDKPLYAVDYSGMGVLAIKAIQEQEDIIDSQAKRIAELSEMNDHMLQTNKAILQQMDAMNKQIEILLKRTESIKATKNQN